MPSIPKIEVVANGRGTTSPKGRSTATVLALGLALFMSAAAPWEAQAKPKKVRPGSVVGGVAAGIACADDWNEYGELTGFDNSFEFLAQCCYDMAKTAGEQDNDEWLRQCENEGASHVKAGATEGATIQSTVENFTSRNGGDYTMQVLATHWQCQERCLDEARCAAWTYNTFNQRCYLKDSVPAPSASGDGISGVIFSVEPFTDRAGSDYHRFLISASHSDGAGFCRAVCVSQAPTCRAYTFVEPGYQSSSAVCYLKNRVPAASNLHYTTSGFVGAEP
jgi:hypothetical protein